MQTDQIRAAARVMLTALKKAAEDRTINSGDQKAIVQAVEAIGMVTFLAEIAAQLAELNEQLKPQKVSVEVRNIPIAER